MGKGCPTLSYRFALLAGCGNFFSCLSIHPEIFAGPWGCLRDVSHPLPSRLHKRFLLSGSSSCFLYWQYYVHCSSCLSIHPKIFVDPWESLRNVSHPLPRWLPKQFLLSGSSSCFLYWQYYVHCSSCLSIHPEIFADPWGSLRDVSHPFPRWLCKWFLLGQSLSYFLYRQCSLYLSIYSGIFSGWWGSLRVVSHPCLNVLISADYILLCWL